MFRNIQKFEGIVGNHPIDLFHHTPPHPLFVVDRPQKYGASGGLDVAEKFVAKGSHHTFLKHVELYSRLFQKLPGVCNTEPNMSRAIIRKVFCAQGEEICLVESQMRE
jgi:hypothetical protein